MRYADNPARLQELKQAEIVLAGADLAGFALMTCRF